MCVCVCLSVSLSLSLSLSMCVFVCLCVCAYVCRGGRYKDKCPGMGTSVHASVVWVLLSCQCPAKTIRNLYKIGTTFVRILYEFRNFQGASHIGTVNVVVTNFVRIPYEFHIKFVRISHEVRTICTNLYHFPGEQKYTNTLNHVFVSICVCARVVGGGVVVCVGMGAWCVRAWVISACIGGFWVVGFWVCVGVDGWIGGWAHG